MTDRWGDPVAKVKYTSRKAVSRNANPKSNTDLAIDKCILRQRNMKYSLTIDHNDFLSFCIELI